MSDFRAKILGELDESKIEKKLNEIENKKFTLKNFTIETKTFVSQIQTALNNAKFKFTIDEIDGREITVQMESAGSSAAKSFKKGFQSGSNDLFKELATLQKKMGSIEFSIETLDPKKNSEQIKVLEAQLSSLKVTYRELLDSISTQDLSPRQWKELQSIIDNTEFKLETLRAQAADTKRSLSESISSSVSSGKLEAEIAKLTVQYQKLGNSGSKNIGLVKADLADLRSLLADMPNHSGDELISDYEKFNEILVRTKNHLSIVASEAKGSISALDTNKLSSSIEKWMKDNKTAAKEYAGALENLQARLRNLDPASDDARIALSELKNEFEEIKRTAIAAGKTGQSFKDTFSEIGRAVIGTVSAIEIFHKAVEIFKEMYQHVYDIDTAMTNLYKVTDASASRYDRFLKDSAQSAKELGRTISSLVEQTANWAKLGYSLNEAEQLAKISSIYANVADVDDATAVSDMVTAMKAFNIEASKAISIIDPLNELGNKFAVSAADLGDGLSRSASAMNAAGTDMYKTLALITGGAEITQNASEFGNFLKIASMRIRGMTGELQELGEEVDSSVDSISKVQTQILNLTQGRVNIFNGAGEFRDYYDIMKDISMVVDDLTSTDRASLYEILFGKQRGNQGAALIQAFQSGQIEKAYEAAVNSAGSAAAEQSRWMESLEAKVNQFKASYQALSEAVLDSDFLKNLVDGGTAALNVFTSIIETFGTFSTLSGVIAGALSFKGVGELINQFLDSITLELEYAHEVFN